MFVPDASPVRGTSRPVGQSADDAVADNVIKHASLGLKRLCYRSVNVQYVVAWAMKFWPLC